MTLLSVKSIQGKRKYMEDRYAYLQDSGITVAMLCDGHGGFQVAEDTCEKLPTMLIDALVKVQGSNIMNALAIRQVIVEWGAQMRSQKSGSTLTGIVRKNDVVYLYSLGDSRTCLRLAKNANMYLLQPTFDQNGRYTRQVYATVSQPSFFCTQDHDPGSEFETSRVISSGGGISGGRLNGILSVTRALGDTDVGPGLSIVPDVYWTSSKSVVGPVFMYSDGLYELQRYTPVSKDANFSDQHLYNLATRYGSGLVVDYALQQGSDDNITAMLVQPNY